MLYNQTSSKKNMYSTLSYFKEKRYINIFYYYYLLVFDTDSGSFMNIVRIIIMIYIKNEEVN